MRVLHFLPYYVAGLYCEEKHLNSIRHPRFVGSMGILSTLAICFRTAPQYLGHVYFASSREVMPHVVFFLQYLLCGVEVLSVILVVRSIAFPLFPFGHSNSTLAIYEWHWPIVGLVSWGQVPFTAIKIPSMSNPAMMVFVAKHMHPLLSIVAAHVVAYGICVALGSTSFWRLVRPISDPDCRSLFVPSTHEDCLGIRHQQSNCLDMVTLLDGKSVSFDMEDGRRENPSISSGKDKK